MRATPSFGLEQVQSLTVQENGQRALSSRGSRRTTDKPLTDDSGKPDLQVANVSDSKSHEAADTDIGSSPEVCRRVMVLFQGHRGEPESIGQDLFRTIRSQLASGITSPRELTTIDLWLESPGGDAHAAYKIALLLRSYARTVRVVVPDYAKSAATLLSMAADSIFMAPAAELGPLDAQIGYEKEGVTISALDVARSLENLAEVAMNMALGGGAAVLQATRLSRAESLSAMVDFATRFMQPAVDKLDPTMIHWSSNLLEVAVHYGERLLSTRESVPSAFSSADVSQLPQMLVERYPTHGFVISADEARSLGLPVFSLDEYDLARTVLKVHEQFERDHNNIVHLLPPPQPGQHTELGGAEDDDDRATAS